MQTLPITKLYESPTNPRKITDKAKDAELEQSVRERGILQALVVRKNPSNGHSHEVVFGSRRLRAALKVGLEDVPVDEREMTDEEVREGQFVENLQRDDIHPLDEADGFKRLLDGESLTTAGGGLSGSKPLSVEEIAARIGRPKSHVYARLKLCVLCKEGRAAFLDGVLTPATALIVARIPDPKLQAKAVKYARTEGERYGEDGQLSASEMSRYVQRTFMLRLKDAPFKPNDAELVPAAGACITCDKRTGANPELFEDVDEEDTCTDGACYQNKVDAQWAQTKAKAEAAQKKVVESPAATKKLFGYGDALAHSTGLVDLSTRCHQDPKQRTYRQLLGKDAATAVIKAPSGAAVEVVEQKGLTKLLKDAGHNFSAKPKRSDGPSKATKAKEKTENAVHETAIARITAALVERVEKKDPTPALWRWLAQQAFNWNIGDRVLERRGIEASISDKKLFDSMKGTQYLGLLFELCLPESYRADDRELLDVCKLLGVDAKAITTAVRKELEAPAKQDAPAKGAEAKTEKGAKKSKAGK